MSITDIIMNKVRAFFRHDGRIHLRQESTATPSELVDLIDRFIDSDVRYGFEWDDFISWKNENPSIEKVRQEIGCYEHLLFSKDRADRDKYVAILIDQRNAMAAIIGLPPRPSKQPSPHTPRL